MGHRLRGRVLFKFNVWVPIGKCNRVLERQKKLRNQIFRALTASADVPSSVIETTDTTSTLPPPPPPLQKPTGHRDIWEKGHLKMEEGDGDTVPVNVYLLIPLSRGSFDVLVGMDWLSKRKFGIVCHGKVVRIPFEGDEILRVHGERTQGVVKTLMNTKKWRVKLRRVRAMSMTIQSSVKDKILATSSETSKVENAPAEMLRDLDQQMEKRADDGKANVVTDALSRKERVKPRRVRAMAMTIQYGVRGMILTAQSEAFKQENVPLVGSEMDEAHASSVDHLDWRWEIYFVVFGDTVDIIRNTIDNVRIYHPQMDGQSERAIWTLEEGSLIGPELVQETTDKVVVIKEKLQAARDRQKSYADSGRKMTEYEVGENVLLKVSPWKGVMRFGKKGKLALCWTIRDP
ncbi:hypothetical protein Tco_0543316 [Tanacetum coccineum]